MLYNNNPFNIRYDARNRWLGLIGHQRGFCEFSHVRYGIRAAAYLLMHSYRKRGLRTYQELVSAFAPPSENPTDHYVDFVCSGLHVFPFDVPKSQGNFAGMLYRMWLFEQGSNSNPWPARFILDVIKDFKIQPYGK